MIFFGDLVILVSKMTKSPKKNDFISYIIFWVSLVLKHILNTFFFLPFFKETNFCMGQIWTFYCPLWPSRLPCQHRTWTWLAPAIWQAPCFCCDHCEFPLNTVPGPAWPLHFGKPPCVCCDHRGFPLNTVPGPAWSMHIGGLFLL